jgi:hypothetical protein
MVMDHNRSHAMPSQRAKSEPRDKKIDRVPDPTPEEIAARCLEIQMRWSETERIGRGNPEATPSESNEN